MLSVLLLTVFQFVTLKLDSGQWYDLSGRYPEAEKTVGPSFSSPFLPSFFRLSSLFPRFPDALGLLHALPTEEIECYSKYVSVPSWMDG